MHIVCEAVGLARLLLLFRGYVDLRGGYRRKLTLMLLTNSPRRTWSILRVLSQLLKIQLRIFEFFLVFIFFII